VEGQRRTRAGLASEREQAAGTLKTERASLAVQSRQIETEAAPIRYVAEFVGADTDNERAIFCSSGDMPASFGAAPCSVAGLFGILLLLGSLALTCGREGR
jgi:hypothetical protein